MVKVPVAYEAGLLMSRACEVLAMEMALKAALVCQEGGRSVVEAGDVYRAVQATEGYDLFMLALAMGKGGGGSGGGGAGGGGGVGGKRQRPQSQSQS